MEKSALDSLSEDLMEQVVDPDNLERAWRNVKANRGAPGPDGITLKQFPEHIRPLWPKLRQQLLDGTYRPEAARRKAIAKPDSGERLLGIPNILDRLIQQAILQVLTPIFDPDFSESSFGFRPKRSAHGAIKQVRSYIRQRALRRLAELDRVVKTEADKPIWSSAQRVAFVVIAFVAIMSMTSLAYLVAGSSSTGPAAAILLEREYRGELRGTFEEPYLPSGRPIPFKEMKNIKPLTQTLWSRSHVEADFVAYREALRGEDPKVARQLRGAMVIVKTERCQQRFRSCATATAALQKRARLS